MISSCATWKPRFNLLDHHTYSYEDARKKYVVVVESS